MAKVRKIGRVTFRELTNEEALREYGTSFVFVGTPPGPTPREAVTKLTAGHRRSKRSPKLPKTKLLLAAATTNLKTSCAPLC
jgi:hypothetical protein